MALKSNAVTTVARLSSFLGIATPATGSAKETLLIAYINSITAFIESYLGFDPKEQTYTNEEYDSDGGETINLRAFPVNSASAFTLQIRSSAENEDDWDTIPEEDYHVDYEAGIIYGAGRRQFNSGRRIYRVTYTAGYAFDNTSTFLSDTDGGEIEMAAWMLGAEVYSRGKGGGGIQSEAIGDYRIVYKSAMFKNDEIQTLLDAHARIDGTLLASPLTPLHN